MPGSFDLDFMPAELAAPALPIVVCLYDPEEEDGGYTILPNVRCLRVDYKEGPEPPVARFQYLTADLLELALGWPAQFEQLWPINAQGDYVVQVDDRLVVLTFDPYGDPLVLFDGFAQIPQADVEPTVGSVTFAAIGVAVRLWDNPIYGRAQRNGDVPDTTDGTGDIIVDLPCRFNPASTAVSAYGGYQGNCVAADMFTVPAEYEGTGDAGGYPVFIDPLIIERDYVGDLQTDYDEVSDWWISDAVKYLLQFVPSPDDDAGNPYVYYPTFDSLDDILQTYGPEGDILNPDETQIGDCVIRDYDASNKPVMEALSEILHYGGFLLNFQTITSDDGTPQTNLSIARRDALAAAAPKLIFLAAAGTSFDPTENNTTALHLARDCNQIANAWAVESQLGQVEATFYLAPGFQPNPGDETTPQNWFTSNLTGATDDKRRMYRWYIADECADGHWNATEEEFNKTPMDFSPLFPPLDDGTPTYVKRYRPGSKKILSKDANGAPLKAILEVYVGAYNTDPYIPGDGEWNTDGWQTVTKEWRLLDDRLGIEITAENPEQWVIGTNAAGSKITINGISAQTVPTDETAFALRLTTVIDADYAIDAQAPMRIASPTLFARWRTADAKDHFQYGIVAPNSLNYVNQGGNGTDPVVMRDDTQAAVTHAEQLRSAHEFPPLAGSVTIPFITDYYQLSDRVELIYGRDATLQVNIGTDMGEDPAYPWVTAFSWVFENTRQQTILQLSDRRAEVRNL